MICDPRDYSSPGSSVHGIIQEESWSSHSLLQGIFLTQGSNPGLLHCRQILYHLSHQGSPLETGASPHQIPIVIVGGNNAGYPPVGTAHSGIQLVPQAKGPKCWRKELSLDSGAKGQSGPPWASALSEKKFKPQEHRICRYCVLFLCLICGFSLNNTPVLAPRT